MYVMSLKARNAVFKGNVWGGGYFYPAPHSSQQNIGLGEVTYFGLQPPEAHSQYDSLKDDHVL